MFNLSTPTYSAWIKTTQTGIQYIIDHDVYYGGSLILSNGALEFNHSGATTTAITSTKVNDGTWHFVAMTFDGAYVRLYIDGALQGTFYGPSLGFLSFEDLYIGERGNNGNFFNGSIDDVRIYNRALSSSEITALYNGQLSYYQAVPTIQPAQNLASVGAVVQSILMDLESLLGM